MVKRGKDSKFMKKGQVYEGIIERVDFPNNGHIHLPTEGKTVVVKDGGSG